MHTSTKMLCYAADPLVRIAPDHGLDAPRLWVPASFKPQEVLPETLHRRADDARWLIHTIASKTAYGGNR